RHVMDQIVASGRVERAGLGIFVKDADRDDAEYLGLQVVGGVRVESFPAESSPAKAAGLQEGDVIVAIDGAPVKYVAQLQETVGFRHPGETVKVDIVRKDGKHQYAVRLTSVDQPTTVVATAPEPVAKSESAGSVSKTQLGLVTEPLTAARATEV